MLDGGAMAFRCRDSRNAKGRTGLRDPCTGFRGVGISPRGAAAPQSAGLSGGIGWYGGRRQELALEYSGEAKVAFQIGWWSYAPL